MIRIRVADMSCAHCVQSITRAVGEVDAAARVQVDLESKVVAIDAAAAPAERYREAIARAGFTPALLRD